MYIRISNIINNNGNTSPNQFVVRTTNGVYFQSFDTVIAVKNKDGVFLDRTALLQSNVTIKHLYIFLTKYIFFYEVDRKLITNHLAKGIIKYADKGIEID